MPPNFYHQVSCSRRQFSLARIFFFRHDFLFSARLFFRHVFFFFGATVFFGHDFFYSILQVTADLWQFHLIRKFNVVAIGCLKCCFLLFLLLISFSTCTGVLPTYTPPLNVERVDLIERYFHLGLGYSEILLFLGSLHGCFLSLRQLKRILKQQGLGRRRNRSNPREVCQAIEQELRGSGSTIGYRQMTQRLLHAHCITTDKESERQRRKYKTAGPNHLWHIDGYDKLKPFDFCIHGAIDGYSRHIMWIEVGSTNNDPFVIAQYY